MAKLGIVYEIRNTTNDKRYIGSSIHPRERKQAHFRLLRKGKHHSIILQNSFNKHGESAFFFSVIENGIPQDYLIEREQYWIDKLQPEYNIAPKAGTSQGIKRTDEYKEKLRKSVLGRRHTEEARANMRAAQKYVKHFISDETRAKINKRLRDPDMRAKIGATSRGRPCKEETRLKLSVVNKGRKFTDEWRAKMSASLKGNKCALGCKRSPEECERISAMKSKPVRQIDKNTGEIIKEWSSATQAANELGLVQSSISAVCIGRRKSTGGYKWVFVS